MQHWFLWIWIVFVGCSETFDEDADCALEDFNKNRKTYQIITDEPVTLKRYRDSDTAFWYAIWNDGSIPTTLIFEKLSLDPERAVDNTPLEMSGGIKITCQNDFQVDNRPTRAIITSNVVIVEYCPVTYTFIDEVPPLIGTRWRFVGFDTGSQILSPTCNESYLTLRFTTNNTFPETVDNLFYADIYNGRDVCTYVYTDITPNFYNIERRGCEQRDIGSSLSAQRYGARMVLGLLDLDGFVISQNGNLLRFNPENLGDDLLFVAI
jgi:hypothetical protein